MKEVEASRVQVQLSHQPFVVVPCTLARVKKKKKGMHTSYPVHITVPYILCIFSIPAILLLLYYIMHILTLS